MASLVSSIPAGLPLRVLSLRDVTEDEKLGEFWGYVGERWDENWGDRVCGLPSENSPLFLLLRGLGLG